MLFGRWPAVGPGIGPLQHAVSTRIAFCPCRWLWGSSDVEIRPQVTMVDRLSVHPRVVWLGIPGGTLRPFTPAVRRCRRVARARAIAGAKPCAKRRAAGALTADVGQRKVSRSHVSVPPMFSLFSRSPSKCRLWDTGGPSITIDDSYRQRDAELYGSMGAAESTSHSPRDPGVVTVAASQGSDGPPLLSTPDDEAVFDSLRALGLQARHSVHRPTATHACMHACMNAQVHAYMCAPMQPPVQ
eukprot:350318-Chlamydomonas_euryale.AAC.20